MSTQKKITSALISVFDKSGLEPIIKKLNELGVKLISTGGTADFIRATGCNVTEVSDLTNYPSIFGGRVKTLHPAIFGGILYRRDNNEDLKQADEYKIEPIDLLIVDLYPFEETLKITNDESQIIEKIDIGGISLIRAAAKNFNDVLIIPSREYYSDLLTILNNGSTDIEQRKLFATRAFDISSHYDSAIYNWFKQGSEENSLKISIRNSKELRYGENPHQAGRFFGNLSDTFEQISGKELSYNNLQDVSGALDVIEEFDDCACVIVKHSNTCGVALRDTVKDAWKDALAGDPVSAFGGIIAFNRKLDKETCEKISEVFFEVLIATDFDDEGLAILEKKKNRIILKLNSLLKTEQIIKSTALGFLQQESDCMPLDFNTWTIASGEEPSDAIKEDMQFGMQVVKHLKSNAIAIVKNKMLIGGGNGQTNRVDAVNQAIAKAHKFGFDTNGSILASDAYFPFADSAETAFKAGITNLVEPGGSIRDNETIEFCKKNNILLVFTGSRHFKH